MAAPRPRELPVTKATRPYATGIWRSLHHAQRMQNVGVVNDHVHGCSASYCPARATSSGVPAAGICPHYADLERGRREEACGRSSTSGMRVMLARPRARASESVC